MSGGRVDGTRVSREEHEVELGCVCVPRGWVYKALILVLKRNPCGVGGERLFCRTMVS